MLESKVEEIIRGLIRKSKEDQVSWYPADDLGIRPSGYDDYAVNLPDHTLNVWKTDPDEQGNVGVAFTILDGSGGVIYRVTAEPADPMYSVLDELLDLARYKARKLGELFDFLKESMATDDVIGLGPNVIEEGEIPF